MNKKCILSFCIAFAVIFLMNNNVYAAQVNVTESDTKPEEAISYGDEKEIGHRLISYVDSGIGSRLSKSIFGPPSCVHMSDIFEWNEYQSYSWNSRQHSLNTYRDYRYIGCGCSGTVKMTDNAWSNHRYSYRDMGHSGNQHIYQQYCYCGYVNKTIRIPCPGGNSHIAPMSIQETDK